MLNTLLTRIFGSKGERDMRKLQPKVEAINALEPRLRTQSDAELASHTGQFRQKLENGATLDDLLIEAFAVVREVARRTVSMRHFDMQLIGGMVLHQGKIAEMKTGEGKTLVATLPAYLNALEGKGVHLITVNDYLARRDAEWMGPIYKLLGMELGIIQHSLGEPERKKAYATDIAYGTNNEFGFDYLRDNMKYSLGTMVQRKHNYAIVDEVDSILIDEARTPLIISGPSEESTDKYYRIDKVIPRLKKGEDYQVEEKTRTVFLTEEGTDKAQGILGIDNLYDPVHLENVHHLNQALRAHALFKRDVDYMVKDGQVVIVDEFTGRLMPGRRWSDGLHQAVEAKEGVRIERENQTLATITFQNYFRMYSKLAGMTGTADTEAVEFDNIYKLEVVAIPPNRTLIRNEHPDLVYRTEGEKFQAVVEEIAELHEKGQPVLVGTITIEKSEGLSGLLRRRGIPHVVLNAKYHEKEADIVAQAGRLGAATIATNMAGRGTDILLGGNPARLAPALLQKRGVAPDQATQEQQQVALEEARKLTDEEHAKVVELGGLHIIGTERHESRRIDNQLRGRSGRQGDPGSSRFYLSLEDELLRIFGSERISGLMKRLGMEEGMPIFHPMINRSIERAQTQVEARNFGTRKHLLEYDDVMNKQREEIYRLRREQLEGGNHRDYVLGKAQDILDWLLDAHASTDIDASEWTLPELWRELIQRFGLTLDEAERDRLASLNRDQLQKELSDAVLTRYTDKEKEFGQEAMRQHERYIMLSIIDSHWKDHLLAMDHLKEGIGLRGYGQRDPLAEYKRESFDMFVAMKERLEDDIVRYLFLLSAEPAQEVRQRERVKDRHLVYSAPSKEGGATTTRRTGARVGRNEPCPCGSGKKYKRCCALGEVRSGA
ncbi:MAG: preprotein translocase subunit SecA [Acidobacteria bacterium]|nr:preprotein translocase subunit SecA [Acidobacteriota bacterium]